MSYFKNINIKQDIETSTGNSTTTNLLSAGVFTGTSEETLGINGIQFYLFADQDCSIEIQQSLDSTNWDVSDTFTCLANESCTQVVMSMAPYYRAIVTNTDIATTTILRFACGMTPVISPFPRALTNHGRIKVESSLIDQETDIKAKIVPFGQIKTVDPVRIAGTSFSGTTPDTNFWTETSTGSGVVIQSGQITLATGTTADSTVKYESKRRARHVSGSSNELKFTGRLASAAAADNLRRMGAYDDDDGFFFQVNGTTFGIGSRKNTSDTVVNSGSFNGHLGPHLSLDTSMGNFVIWYWEKSARFFVNGEILHTVQTTTSSLVDTNTLPIRMENINFNGDTTNHKFDILTASITRLGNLKTNPTYYHISGGAASHIMKRGAGVLHGIQFNNTSGTSITVYDGTTTGGDVIGIITTTTSSIGNWPCNIPFSNGLLMVTVGNSLDATISYE